jgi:hypothetical protein
LVIQIEQNLNYEAIAALWQKLGLSQPLYWCDRLEINTKLTTALDKKAFQLLQKYSDRNLICQQLVLDL